MSSHGSGKLNSGKSSSARRTTMSNSSKTGKEELHKKSGSGEDQDGCPAVEAERRLPVHQTGLSDALQSISFVAGTLSDCLCSFPPFWSDPYEDHSGSLRLITIKPTTAQPTYSYPSSSSHSQDSVVVNGDVSQQQDHRTEQCDHSG